MKKILAKGSWHFFFKLVRYTTIVWVIISVFCSSLYAYRSSGQNMNTVRIDLDVSRMSIEEVLNRIEQKTSFRFIYNHKDVETRRKVTMHVTNVSVLDALRQMFNHKPMRYKQEESLIILLKQDVHHLPVQALGGIEGIVKDAENGSALVGANVWIAETKQGVAADIDGKFTLSNIPVGTYTLTISFIGYQSTTIENVKVTANNVSNIEVPLKAASSNLDEVVIKGDVDVRYTSITNSTEEALISDIRDASTIVTGISNLQIARSLDRDASDVMKRVPGVTVLNNFVLVRGMDPRYNVTYLNNMLVPSTESDSRAFGFNLIPSGLIDDIKIYKAPAPELPGGFGGGVVKVNTKKSQATRHIQVDVSTQYRTGSSFADYYTGSSATSKDMWAMGEKTREVPAIFRTNPIKLPRFDLYPTQYMEAVRSLPEVNNLTKGHQTLDRRFNFNYYDSFKIGGVRLNNLTSAGYTYQRTNQYNTRGSQGSKNWQYNTDGKPVAFRPNDNSLDSLFMENVRLSLLENLELKINDNHKVAFNLFANRSAENNTLLTAEIHNGGATSAGMEYPITAESFNALEGGTKFRNVGFEYRVRDLVAGQVSGNHLIGKKLTVDWNVGQITQTDDTPDWQTFLFNEMSRNNWQWALTANTTDNNTRMRYHTDEKMKIGGADLGWNVFPFLTLKAGTLLQKTHREFVNANFNVSLPPFSNVVEDQYKNLQQPWFNLQKMYADENFREDGQGYNMLATFSAMSYSFDQSIMAGYLASRITMLDKKLELYGGVRYENEYTQLYDSQRKPVIVDSTKSAYTSYYLPSVHLTWNINTKHKLRTSFGKSIDRPAYRERSTAGYYSVRETVNYSGNPSLVNARLDNFDLRWEWYPHDNEFIALGFYYKHIDKPIEMIEMGSSGFARLYRTWVNKKWAKLYGFEMEARKTLDFIPIDHMKHFSIIVNGSYMFTEVRENISLVDGQTTDVRLNRPLTGSSPYAFNANLYYEQPRLKTLVTLSYNYIGTRIIVTAPSFVGNLHENPQQQLDLVFIQPIGKYLKVKAGVQNLLNLPIVRWRDANMDGEYHPGVKLPEDKLIDIGLKDNADHEAERYKVGSYYSLGITATF